MKETRVRRVQSPYSSLTILDQTIVKLSAGGGGGGGVWKLNSEFSWGIIDLVRKSSLFKDSSHGTYMNFEL